MLRAILNKSWRQHPIRHQLYGHMPPITKTIQVRRTRHAGHSWRGKDELISDVLLWTPVYGQTKAVWPARTYIQQLCEDRGCSPEDLPEAMYDKERWQERVRDILARCTRWWWWWWWWVFLRYSIIDFVLLSATFLSCGVGWYAKKNLYQIYLFYFFFHTFLTVAFYFPSLWVYLLSFLPFFHSQVTSTFYHGYM